MGPMWKLSKLALMFTAGLVVCALDDARADLAGHGGMVRTLAFSDDGRRVLSGSFDFSAILWDFEEQREIAVLDGHEGPVNAVRFLPGGERALTAGDDRVIRVWSLAGDTPRLERSLTGHGHKIMALAIGPEGRWIASGAWDRSLRIWSPETGEQIRKIDVGVPVNALAVINGGTQIAVGGHDPFIRVFDVATGRAKGKLEGHRMGITDLAASPDGKRLLSASIDKTVRLWDAAALRPLQTFEDHESQVYAVRFLPNGNGFVSAGRNGFLTHRLFDRAEPVRVLRVHERIVWSLAVSPDGRFVVSGSSDDTARVWHLETGDRIGGEAETAADEPRPWLSSTHPGAKLFGKCARCHALSADGRRRSGPHLVGLFGRKVGSVPGYNYSEALRHGDFQWNQKTLFDLFDKGPDKYLPGTKMPVQRVPNAQDLAQLIDYLEEITKNGAIPH